MSRRRNKKYSAEFKVQAVEDYLNGGGSLRGICRKYEISDDHVLGQWIKCYNGHKEFRERRGAGTEIYMTKERKTTLEERIEIVSYCIENGENYPATIEKCGVSYQQIYSLVRKYEEKGVEGLKDGRGRTKPTEEMNEVEKLQAENPNEKWQTDVTEFKYYVGDEVRKIYLSAILDQCDKRIV